ncbi:hypothetical protein T36_0216 [Helicobacter cinaedi]|uniref:hypothetical protein n=1 Tax=Helicobacter cinaedi TaxID=213 RepID=UPI001F35BA83|nr:hypothetical protein [Helicobacter cinaedi]BDB63772.1 hypothetical protein T36_0216 [Helicobacter cinaedi]
MLAFKIACIRALCGLFVRFLQKVANLWYDCGDFDLRNRVFCQVCQVLCQTPCVRSMKREK